MICFRSAWIRKNIKEHLDGKLYPGCKIQQISTMTSDRDEKGNWKTYVEISIPEKFGILNGWTNGHITLDKEGKVIAEDFVRKEQVYSEYVIGKKIREDNEK